MEESIRNFLPVELPDIYKLLTEFLDPNELFNINIEADEDEINKIYDHILGLLKDIDKAKGKISDSDLEILENKLKKLNEDRSKLEDEYKALNKSITCKS